MKWIWMIYERRISITVVLFRPNGNNLSTETKPAINQSTSLVHSWIPSRMVTHNIMRRAWWHSNSANNEVDRVFVVASMMTPLWLMMLAFCVVVMWWCVPIFLIIDRRNANSSVTKARFWFGIEDGCGSSYKLETTKLSTLATQFYLSRSQRQKITNRTHNDLGCLHLCHEKWRRRSPSHFCGTTAWAKRRATHEASSRFLK